jgi:hypothetical protein
MKKLIDEINRIGNCSNCNGHYKMDGTCFFCGSKNEELASLLSEVKSKMQENENIIGLNDIDNQLLRIKHIEEVDNYLKRKHYYKLFEGKENDLINRIKNSQSLTLDEEDIKLVQLLSTSSLNPDNRMAFGLYTILCNYAGKYKYDKLDFTETVKSLFIDLMKKYTNSPRLVISDIKSKNCGEVLGLQSFLKGKKSNVSTITISQSEIDLLYIGESIMPLQTFFHEYFHLIQESSLIETGVMNRYALNEIEDFVLSKMLPREKYYESNYDSVSFENDAQVVSIMNVLDLLKRYSVPLKENDSRQMSTDFLYANSKLDGTQVRTYEGRQYVLDDLFDNFMKSTDKAKEIMDKYPQLRSIYVEVEGKYHRKPKETVDSILDYFEKEGKKANIDGLNKYTEEIEGRRAN